MTDRPQLTIREMYAAVNQWAMNAAEGGEEEIAAHAFTAAAELLVAAGLYDAAGESDPD